MFGIIGARRSGLFKTAIALLVVLFANFGFSPVACSSNGETDLEVRVRQDAPDLITAEVFLHNPAGMAAGQLEAFYDPEQFALQDVSAGPLLEEEGFHCEINSRQQGRIGLGWFALAGTEKSGVLFRATFQSEAGQSLELDLQNIRLFAENGAPLPFGPDAIRLQIGMAEAWIQNIAHVLEAAPFIQEGRTMVTVRFVSEQLGAKVRWLPESRQVHISDDQRQIQFTIDSLRVMVDNEAKSLDVAPVIVQGRTFVPLRFVSETLGAAVAWHEATQTVTIACPVEGKPKPEGESVVRGRGTITGSGNVIFKIDAAGLNFEVDLVVAENVTFTNTGIGAVTVTLTDGKTLNFGPGATVEEGATFKFGTGAAISGGEHVDKNLVATARLDAATGTLTLSFSKPISEGQVITLAGDAVDFTAVEKVESKTAECMPAIQSASPDILKVRITEAAHRAGELLTVQLPGTVPPAGGLLVIEHDGVTTIIVAD